MKGQKTSGVVRTRYTRCGQIKGAPTRVFDWKLRKEEEDSKGTQTCVFVFHNATGEKIPVYTSLANTLQSVKEQISASVTIPPQMMKLSFQGQILQDECTLVSYGIAHLNCLHLTCAKGGGDSAVDAASHRRLMGITVCCIDDSPRPILARLRICARPSDKILEVKLQLEAQTGVPAGSQRITLGGRTLANEQTLIECGVDESKVLQLVFPFGPGDVMSSASLKRNDHHLAIGSAAVERLCFPVIVKEVWPTGKSRHVGLTTDSTIRSLKDQLANWSGITPDKQILLHRGRVLQDDLTASYYNLEGGAMLDLAIVGGVKPVLQAVQKPQEKRRSGGPRRTVYFAAADKADKADYKAPLEASRKSRVSARSNTKQLVYDEMLKLSTQLDDPEEEMEEVRKRSKGSAASSGGDATEAVKQPSLDEVAVKKKVSTPPSQQLPDDAAPPASQPDESEVHKEPCKDQDSSSNEVPRITLTQTIQTEEEQARMSMLTTANEQAMLAMEQAAENAEGDAEESARKSTLLAAACQIPHSWAKQGSGLMEMEEKLGEGEFEHPDYDEDPDEEQREHEATPQVENAETGPSSDGKNIVEATDAEAETKQDVEPLAAEPLAAEPLAAEPLAAEPDVFSRNDNDLSKGECREAQVHPELVDAVAAELDARGVEADGLGRQRQSLLSLNVRGKALEALGGSQVAEATAGLDANGDGKAVDGLEAEHHVLSAPEDAPAGEKIAQADEDEQQGGEATAAEAEAGAAAAADLEPEPAAVAD